LILFELKASAFLQRNIAVFLGGVGDFLGGELLESADNAETGVARLDNVVDISVACGIVFSDAFASLA